MTELAEILRDLASSGCHNWNLVSPTPWLPTIAQAVSHVKQAGIRMPIVYNTSGFEKRETLAAYSSLLDVALVDVRYAYPATAKEACGTAAYVNAARATLKYCWQTLGPLQSDADGIAQKGVICRILVLPGHADEACANLEWIAENIGTELTLSVMSQYTPAHKATEMPPWDRRVTVDEYRTVTEKLESLGFENGWTQDLQEAPPEGLLGYSMQPE